MELNLFQIRLNGGLMYPVMSKSLDGMQLILKLAQSDIFSITKHGSYPKYLSFEHVVEVQQIELTQTQKDAAWVLKETK